MNRDLKKERQVVILRGIAAQIQSMYSPTWEAVKDLFSRFGWKLTRDEQTNKQTNHD